MTLLRGAILFMILRYKNILIRYSTTEYKKLKNARNIFCVIEYKVVVKAVVNVSYKMLKAVESLIILVI